MIGQLLSGRYKVQRILGAGGFGQTFVAEDTQRPNNPVCVVKQLKPASNDPSFLETARRMFRSEGEVLEKLGENLQIPRLLANFEQDQEFYLVQEFIDGQTLSAELQVGIKWTENQVVDLLKQTLSVLAFVHQNGVIHRDVKPDNIIRRKSDNKLVLVDFGAVKQVRNQTAMEQQKMLSATIAIGTPGYMPSEQAIGKPKPSSDIYALGVIAIQALTGLSPSPQQEDTDTGFRYDHNTGELVWQDKAQVSANLAAILAKMVKHNFPERYASAVEVLQAVEQLQQSVYTPTVQVILNHVNPQTVPFSEPVQTRNQQHKPLSPQVDKGERTLNWLWAVAGAFIFGGLLIYSLTPKFSPISSVSTPNSVNTNDDGQLTLSRAKSEAISTGNLDSAMQIARGIPNSSSAYSDAQKEINKWQADWTNQNNAFTKLRESYNAGRWQEVVDIGNHDIPRNSYWGKNTELTNKFKEAERNLTPSVPAPKDSPTFNPDIEINTCSNSRTGQIIRDTYTNNKRRNLQKEDGWKCVDSDSLD